jgi:hypothetical protein
MSRRRACSLMLACLFATVLSIMSVRTKYLVLQGHAFFGNTTQGYWLDVRGTQELTVLTSIQPLMAVGIICFVCIAMTAWPPVAKDKPVPSAVDELSDDDALVAALEAIDTPSNENKAS